ncbi:MAG TPA: protein kinase [Micropepsaceae bacterium]|jgi:serine/threonine-protein kinase
MTATGSEPTKIGRYEIEGLVGEGAMAKVYRARDPDIARVVAVKVLKVELCIDEDYVSRFLREAKAAGAISHPNIVTVFDVGRFGDAPYITMEFLDEKSLADAIAEHEKLPIKRVIAIGIQMARALDLAHRRGIVHRDVKPGNILLMEKGEVVKITDFGIARLDRSEDLNRTHAGTVLGTPRYMAPEQAAGRAVDGRADLFSLGVILYELLTGKKTFDSNNVATLMLQIMQKDPEPIRDVAPDVPVSLQGVISKLLQKRPEQRFQTGAQLAEALERELAAIAAREEDAKRNRFIPLRVRWAMSAGAGLAMVFLITLGVVYYVERGIIRAQVIDSGAAIAKFIATETAVQVLSQNWVPLELFVKDASERGSFDYLAVTDHDHVVKAATSPDIVGKRFTPPNATLIVKAADFTASEVELPGGKAAFLFDTPILFQKTEIGRIYLGINRVGLDNVLRSTLLLMSNIGILTVLSAVGMLYVFGGLIGRPLKLLTNAMRDFGQGDLDRRIAETRNDEFGQLFSAYNHMADAVQAHIAHDTGARVAPETGAVMDTAVLGHTDANAEATLLTASVRAQPSPEPAS